MMNCRRTKVRSSFRELNAIANYFKEDEELDELEEELEDADDDQGSYQGFDEG